MHESDVQCNRQRLMDHPNRVHDRCLIVKHRYGTFKQSWQMRHFMMRILPKWQGDFSPLALSYNFKRALNLVGFEVLMSNCTQMQRVWLNFG